MFSVTQSVGATSEYRYTFSIFKNAGDLKTIRDLHWFHTYYKAILVDEE